MDFKKGIIIDVKNSENLDIIKKNEEMNIKNEDNVNNEEEKRETKSTDVIIINKYNQKHNISNQTKKDNIISHSINNENDNNNINIHNSKKIETFDKIENPPSKSDNIFSDLEINEMSYEHSLIYEKRTYFECYFSLLKHYHLIMFTFVIKEKYNLFMVKILIFEFFICILFLINMFLYTDNSISHYYQKKGKYDFGYLY